MILIEKALYINLDSRADRKEHMENLLKSTNLDYERFSAIRLEKPLDTYGIRVSPSANNKGSIASIWLSHRYVLEEFLKSDDEEKSFLLLEDDVKFKLKNNNDLLVALGLESCVLDNLDWEMLMISPRYIVRKPSPDSTKKFSPPPNNGNLIKANVALKDYKVSGAHFCIFQNKAAIRSVLQRMQEMEELVHVDHFYVKYCKSYLITSKAVGTEHLGSDQFD